jgi:fluoroacetyl-CoA thioesterase
MPKQNITLEPSTTATVSHTVASADLASSLRVATDQQFPAVFATSRMIALMEVAAAEVMRPLVDDGELSVGVSVSITHTAPTPEGVEVSATATFTGMEGKLFRFEVVANDPAGEIGRGIHTRAIITTERLLAGAAKRK